MSSLTTTCFLLALIGCISGQFLPQAQFEVARKGRTKMLSCTVDSSVTLSSTAIHFYRQKPGDALQRILYFAAGASKATLEPEFTRRFSSGKKDKTFTVTISNINDDDAATYYFALWRGDDKVFSSGTRVYVTAGSLSVDPKVSVYPMSRVQTNQKRVMLYQARDMFPDLVKFTWQAVDQSGNKVDLKDEEILEQREDQKVKITSMLIVDKQKGRDYTFSCSVQHGSKNPTITIPKDPDPDPVHVPAQTCPTSKPKAHEEKQKVKKEEEKEEEKPIYDGFELRRSLYLFSLTYVVLLVKNILYFCTVSFLLYKRYTANKETLRSQAR